MEATLPNTEVKSGKYLTFKLGNEEYGVQILKVREIIGLLDITRVPRTPDFILGVVNLRGKVIPVINLRKKFGLPDVEHTALTCIVVVDLQKVQMGLVVDEVSEVLDIKQEEIEDSPDFGASVDTGFILGIGKVKGHVSILLDIEKVLAQEETLQTFAALSGVNG